MLSVWGRSAVISLLLCSSAAAEPSRLISLQGRLTDAGGTVITLPQPVVFSLYTSSTGGAAFWNETQNVAPDAAGLYEVYLGSVTAIPSSVAFNQDYWLGINVAGDGEMTPRLMFTVSPYAIYASSASYVPDTGISGSTWDGLTGGGITALHSHAGLVNGPHADDHAAGGLDSLAPLQVDVATLTVSHSVYLATSSGRVGIGTSDPQTLLDAAGSILIGTGVSKSTFTATGAVAIDGDLTVAGSGILSDTMFFGLPKLPHVINPNSLIVPTTTGLLLYEPNLKALCYSKTTAAGGWYRGDNPSQPCQ
ncbi:MAG: hypothetical protein ABIJ96_09580 [Elusimicrobiota bacterium]